MIYKKAIDGQKYYILTGRKSSTGQNKLGKKDGRSKGDSCEACTTGVRFY